ncbi:hypothetical protein HQ496_00070, partial [bacterium]|nr:hypothetical protein [bacterium]
MRPQPFTAFLLMILICAIGSAGALNAQDRSEDYPEPYQTRALAIYKQ